MIVAFAHGVLICIIPLSVLICLGISIHAICLIPHGLLITHQSRNDPRTPHDHGNASCSQEMYTRTLALLQSIHVRCVLAMLQVVGVSYLCNRCSGWVHSKCSGLQNAAEYRRIKDWVCSSCNSPPTLPKLQPPPIPTQAVDENSFTIMQFNANGIGNKLTELGEFLK